MSTILIFNDPYIMENEDMIDEVTDFLMELSRDGMLHRYAWYKTSSGVELAIGCDVEHVDYIRQEMNQFALSGWFEANSNEICISFLLKSFSSPALTSMFRDYIVVSSSGDHNPPRVTL